MSIRVLVQPWWLRWLITWVFLACAFVVIFGLQITHPWERVPPTVLGLALAGLSFAAAGAATLLQSPARAAYTQALAGLSSTQEAAASHALRGGDVPADPSVLAGALRCGAVTEHYYQRAGRSRSIVQIICGALLAVCGIILFLVADPRRGVLWLLMAALFVVSGVLRERQRAALGTRLAQLRAAADTVPSITAADIAPTRLPRRNNWHIVIFVLMTGIAVAGFTTLADQPRRDCRTANAAVNYLIDHRDMLVPQNIIAGGPDSDAYQGWADHLARYASQVSASDVAPHLRTIADRAHDMVALVSQARAAKPSRPLIDVQSDYGKKTLDILNEQHALSAVCRR